MDYGVDRKGWQLEAAYFVTIFGWSAPPTDVDARDRIVDTLARNQMRRIMQVEIIDLRAEELLSTNLSPIAAADVHSHALQRLDQSWLAAHPRLTCEALFEATMQQSPITSCPLPEAESLNELQEWAQEFDRLFPQATDEGYKGQG